MKKICCIMLLCWASGCKEQYDAPIKQPLTGYLVVEGIINSAGATNITLSRTTQLDNRGIQYEKAAVVKVEADDNSFFVLQESSAGHYTAGSLNLNPARRYRLNISTSTGRQYLSDFVAVRNNPPIDSISWKQEKNGLQLYVSTHDDRDTTRYYQWEFSETWEFHSAFPAVLKYEITKVQGKDNYQVVYRDSSTFGPVAAMYYCWKTENSSSISLGSSAKLSKDMIYLPLTFIEPASWKLSVLYSINVRQYSWTKEGYGFMEQMKKNTEGKGSVFDAQPSELNGNMRCVNDPTEPVIGFVNICPVREQRIFIRKDQLSDWKYFSDCVQFEIENNNDSIQQKASGLLPAAVASISPFGNRIATFFAAEPECVDCRLRGTPVKPNFWP